MISKKDIEHLKDLSRVEFGENETEKLAKDLGAILAHIDSLKDADVSGVAEAVCATDLKNIFRADNKITHPTSLTLREEPDEYSTAKDLIGAFPEKHEADHGTYLKVKSIL